MLYELGPPGMSISILDLLEMSSLCAELQAFASITSLLTHLEKIVNLAVDVDLPTPVADALLETLYGESAVLYTHCT